MKIVATVVLLISLVSCNSKKPDQPQSSNEWKELDSFHMIMAEAFHPYKDSSNLAPAKSLATAMADEAAKWATVTLPEKVDNTEMTNMLQKLATDTQSFLILSADNTPDSVLGQSLSDLHDHFHKIQEGWYSVGKGGHEHH